MVAESEVLPVSPLISSLNIAPVDLKRSFTKDCRALISRADTHAVAMMARRWSNLTSPVLGPSILSNHSLVED